MREELMELKEEIRELREETFAMEILADYKKQNKRLFVIILVILSFWFITIGAFVYYINTTGYEETMEIADTSDGGNAYVGDNCNNGVINGDSN